MGSNKQPIEGQIYKPLSNIVIEERPTSTVAIIKDVLRNTVPDKDLRRGFEQRRGVYLSIAKNTAPKQKKKVREKKHYMTRKEKSQLGILKCPRTGWSYAELSSLHDMWCSHISDLLNTNIGIVPGTTDCVNYSRIMSRADLHGAEMLVIKSKNPSLVGIIGICVCDNRDTFGIVTKEDKYKTIPKINSVFKIIVHHLSIIVYGKYMMTRSAERSVKKIKSFMLPVL